LQLATRVPVIVLLQAEDVYRALRTSRECFGEIFSKVRLSFYHIPVVQLLLKHFMQNLHLLGVWNLFVCCHLLYIVQYMNIVQYMYKS
jgi:hypothetical protein